MIIAVDFDGTLCQDAFPNIGAPELHTIEALKMLKNGGATVILWTCRTGEMLEAAVRWCSEFLVPIDHVNCNTPEIQEKYGEDTRKIFADIYLDDKGVHPNQFHLCLMDALGYTGGIIKAVLKEAEHARESD